MSSDETVNIIAAGPAYGSLTCAVGVEEEAKELQGTLTFHDIGYEVSLRCGRGRKVILESCSGIMRLGLNAIIGPTGSGKTTLLDIMADRKGKKGVSGTVLVNGKRLPRNFKCISGYVVQDDLMMGTLSVRENLQFSAALRLPSHMTRQQRRDRVEKVIEELGLQSCADTKIGTEFLRGVSGGERKRTSIGMELIIEPQVLFLDEATTGLDAYTAVSVVQLLKQLSHTAKHTVIFSIHQPRYSIFKLFDTLTLLSRGEVVFQGPAQQALPYFDNLGFRCGDHENPADFFLDVLISHEEVAGGDKGVDLVNMDTNSLLGAEERTERVTSTDRIAVSMVKCYQQSNMCRKNDQQLQQTMESVCAREHRGGRERNNPATYATNFLWQMCTVGIRSAVTIMRDPLSFFLLLLKLAILSLLVGTVYFKLDHKHHSENTLFNVITDRMGAFYFILLIQVFVNLSGVDLFIKQKALFIHENASGYYRVSVFFFVQVFTDLIPKRVIPVCVFSLIAYFMVGLQPVAGKFFFFLLTLCLASISSASIMYSFSSMVAVTEVAILLTSLAYVLAMLFGGFFIALDSLPKWLQWIKYISLFRYSLEALCINEIAGEFYQATSNSTDQPCELPGCLNGTQALIDRGFETSTAWLWYDQLALLTITLVFLVFCYVNLRMAKKHK